MMKRLFCLVTFFVMIVTTALAASPQFDNMRTVLVVKTTQDSYASRYMAQRLKEPFRIPYWDRKEMTEPINPDRLNEDTMRALATQYQADIVVAPIVNRWYWTQRHIFFYDDDDIITECLYNLTVYAYNRQDDTLKSYSASGYERDSWASLNNPLDILQPAMDTIMKKLPYKRIPTDIER